MTALSGSVRNSSEHLSIAVIQPPQSSQLTPKYRSAEEDTCPGREIGLRACEHRHGGLRPKSASRSVHGITCLPMTRFSRTHCAHSGAWVVFSRLCGDITPQIVEIDRTRAKRLVESQTSRGSKLRGLRMFKGHRRDQPQPREAASTPFHRPAPRLPPHAPQFT